MVLPLIIGLIALAAGAGGAYAGSQLDDWLDKPTTIVQQPTGAIYTGGNDNLTKYLPYIVIGVVAYVMLKKKR